MSTTLHVPMAELPAAITESVRSVLAAHGFVIARLVKVPSDPCLLATGEELSDRERDEVLCEIGRNTAMAIVCLDTNEENL